MTKSASVFLSKFAKLAEFTKMHRRLYKIVSLFVLVSVLFLQLAISVHACPMQFSALLSQTSTIESAASDCDDLDTGMDMSQPGLCQQHCKNEQQSVSDTPLDLAPLTFASSRTVEWLQPPLSTLLVLATHATTPSLHHATSPPSSIQHCCFRI